MRALLVRRFHHADGGRARRVRFRKLMGRMSFTSALPVLGLNEADLCLASVSGVGAEPPPLAHVRGMHGARRFLAHGVTLPRTAVGVYGSAARELAARRGGVKCRLVMGGCKVPGRPRDCQFYCEVSAI